MVIIPVPVTGQTALYSSQMQREFEQNIFDKGIECYCLDAPEYIPAGTHRTHFRGTMVAADWVSR